MFRHRAKLFSLLGFPVRVDLSWLFIAVLVAWSLAAGVFPSQAEGLTRGTYWAMGVGGALAFFACIVLHELGHAVVARRMGVAMKGITLFIFGGVGEMTEEPRSAGAEFLIAIAGAVVSLALAAIFYAVSRAPLIPPVRVVVRWLAVINLALAVFNLVPAFPLDGGRVLRAALWRWKGNLRWATYWASQAGSGFGFALMGLAVLSLLSGHLVGAMWWFVLGLFVRGAAHMSYQQLLWRELLAETSVGRLMNDQPVTTSPDVSIGRFVEDTLYRHHYKMFPVTEGEELRGCITTAEIKDLPRDQWASRTVGDVMHPCSQENAIGPDADAVEAFRTMRRTGRSRLMVVDDGGLAGVITMKDLMTYIARRLELEGEDLGGGTVMQPPEQAA